MNDRAEDTAEETHDAANAPEFAVGHVPSWAEARRQQRARLSRIRRAVQRGEYENPLKIAVAADRLLEKLLSE